MNGEIAAILLHCEERGAAPPYGDPKVKITSQGRDVFVVSDLHLAAGKRSDGTYFGTENFFVDGSFERFLRFAHEAAGARGAVLVINGDFVDFLRIAKVPRRDEEFRAWEEILRRIGIPKTAPELRASVSPREEVYGLKTNDYKSVWQLAAAVEGHARLFDALAGWLARGHELVIVKGNHDLQWYWPAVRNHLRVVLADRVARQTGEDPAPVLEQKVLPRVLFADNALLIDEEFYIEHGHRYDKYCHVVGGPLLANGQELNIPFGSFFNRYLLNRIELAYPFLDNVRPRENLLPLLFREHFFLAVRVLFQHLPFALKLIPKRYYRYMFARVFWFFVPVIVLLLMIGVPLAQWWLAGPGPQKLAELSSSKLLSAVASPLGALAWAALSYFFTRVVSYFQLEEPSSLAPFARRKFAESAAYRFITFGHTHNPDQFEESSKWFYNTGTWIPIVEISSAEIRHDRTYTFARLSRDPSGHFGPTVLQRWNDDAGRADPLILVKREG